jgi:mannose-6-phosphate isomerase-like protein (cupin superfamily)
MDLAEFERFIQTELPYKQRIIFTIDDDGLERPVDYLGQLLPNLDKTIKLEQMEKYNSQIWFKCQELAQQHGHLGPVTCHVYRAQQWSKSFLEHSDPDTVVLEVVEGVKVMEMAGTEYILHKGSRLTIPAGTPHRAINRDSSLMLSFGLEKFYVEKL